jgi:hypothetical protein
MLFPQFVIDEIKGCAFWADHLIRSELIVGEIATENDYTSNFTGALRREINSRMIPGLTATVRVLNPNAERRSGADGCVILESDSEFKAGIFEAKWPRLTTHTNCWDSIQRSSGISHFDSQLSRQASQKKYLAIWEMFYSEHKFRAQPNFMPDFGSACVWHSDASMASSKRITNKVPWDDSELISLLTSHKVDITDVFQSICDCNKGVKLPVSDLRVAFGDLGIPRKALVIRFSEKHQ